MGKPNLAGVGIRRLFWDVEVSHNVVLAFRAGYEQTIRPESILLERKIICIAYKFQGERTTHVLHWDRNQDDRAMLVAFAKVAASADELVAHHGNRYDMPFFRTRCLVNGLDPLPDAKLVDTCKIAKGTFLFNSNKLDYISKLLGRNGKRKMELDDWRAILIDKDAKALAKMCSYCKTDVDELEGVYEKMARWVKPKSHVGVMNGKESHTCPHCGGDHSEYFRKRVSASGVVQHQRRCLTCKSYFVISDSANKKYNKQRNGKS